MKSEYDLGFDKGHDLGYKNGYNEGFIWGQREIIPLSFGKGFEYAWSLSDEQKQSLVTCKQELKKRMKGEEKVAEDIAKALAEKRGLSIVRLGDGELMVMAQDMLPLKTIKLRGHMLWKHLKEIPDFESQELVTAATWQADWVGLPIGRGFPDCDALLAQIILKSPPLPAKLTHSVVNYRLTKKKLLADLIRKYRILAVGNTAKRLSEYLNAQGLNCVGAIYPVDCVPDVQRVFKLVAEIDFDIALVTAGVAAVPLCVKIAKELNKIALDFGHMSDELINGLSSI